MADGKVVIDTKLDNSEIDRGLRELQYKIKQTSKSIDTVNKSLSGTGNQIGKEFTKMGDTIGKSFDFAAYNARKFKEDLARYGPDYAEYRRLTRELSQMHHQFQLANMKALMPFHRQLMEVEKDMFKLGWSMNEYAGTNKQFMDEVVALGAKHKKIRDEMIKNDKMLAMSMIQTAGQVLNMTSQAKRITENYQRMKNPLYGVNKAGLAAANALNEMAHQGNAAVLALKMLGPTANMKKLRDMQMMITQGVMRFQAVALGAAATSAILYGSMHKMAMDTNKEYKKAFEGMLANLQKAIQPMVQVFAAVMIHVYNFISAIAKMITKFNEAHPTIAKVASAILLLLPALTLILSPLSIGIGLLNGLKAALASVWTFIGPAVTGLAAMSGTVLLVSSVIVGLTAGIIMLWKNSETFRNVVNKSIATISNFGQALLNLGKYFFWVIADGDQLNDWLGHLPQAWQGAVEKIGQALSNLRKAIIDAFNGNFTGIESIFRNLIPTIIGILVGGIPGLIISASRFVPAIVQGIQSNASQISTTILNITTGIVTFFTTQFPRFLQTGVQIITNLVQGIATALPVIANAFVNIITMILTIIVQMLPVLLQAGIQILQALTNGILLQAVPSLMFAALQIIQTLVNLLAQSLPLLLFTGMTILMTLINGILRMLPSLIQTAMRLINVIISTLVQLLPMIIQVGIQLLLSLVNGIVRMLPMLINCAIQLIMQVANILIHNLPFIINAGTRILLALVNGIIRMLPTLINAAILLINKIVSILVTHLPQIISAGVRILTSLVNGIVRMLPLLMSTASTLIVRIASAIASNLPKIISAGVRILISLVNGIIKVLPQLINASVKLILKIVSTIVSNLPKIISAGVRILTALISGILKILPQLISAAIKLVVAIAKAIIKNLPQIISAGIQILKALIRGIIQVVGLLLSSVKSSVIDPLIKKFKGISLKDIGKDIIKGLISGISSMTKGAGKAISDVAHTLINKFKSILGIHSPSRVFQELGGYVLKGLVNGLTSANLKELGMSVLKDFGGGVIKGWNSVKSFLTALLGGGFSGGGNVTAWLTAALGLTGTPLSWLPGLKKLVQAESGGNPRAINRIPVLGQHATGLLQMLPSTFRAYMLKGHGNIFNPIDNAAAAIRYIKSRYGSVYNTPLFKGGPYKGYAKGTNYHPGGLALVGEKGRELANIPGVGLVLVGLKGPQLLNLPRGTSVIPNRETEKLLSGASSKALKGINVEKATSWMKTLVGSITTPFIPAYADGVGIQHISHQIITDNTDNPVIQVQMDPITVYTVLDGKVIAKTVTDIQNQENVRSMRLRGETP
ncbi:transglycosylase SLT domain-containing protein [Bacillus smithii]|uniref:transglycosylase SLT domain-containing protein n=1 Tax=Bacillus smithii TaxID=1479 RepID=UPI003D2639A5